MSKKNIGIFLGVFIFAVVGIYFWNKSAQKPVGPTQLIENFFEKKVNDVALAAQDIHQNCQISIEEYINLQNLDKVESCLKSKPELSKLTFQRLKLLSRDHFGYRPQVTFENGILTVKSLGQDGKVGGSGSNKDLEVSVSLSGM